MSLQAFWQSLEASKVGDYVATSTWAFPTLETVHVIAIVTVMGSIAVMDLRLLGLTSREIRVTEVERDTLRWTWGAFIIAFVTGLLLFISKATSYTVNPYFLWKMVVIVLAGANMAAFHLITWRSVDKWDTGEPIPLGAKIAGGTSIGLWILVSFLGRAIGFTLDKFTS
jgi:hypothetical protein